MSAERVVPLTKLWDGVIVLQCVCGMAVDYPGHPDERETVTCETCHTTWRASPMDEQADCG